MCCARSVLRSAAFATTLLLASAGAAEAGSLRILNCANQRVQVATYNSNDSVMVVAYKDACLAGRDKAVTLTCASQACKVSYWPSCPGVTGRANSTSTRTGTWIFHNGTLRAMDPMLKFAVNKGHVPAGTKELNCAQFDWVLRNRKTVGDILEEERKK
jgi:hypothetical protein